MFSPFHYLTAELNKAARCFALFVGDRPAVFCAVLPRPNKVANIRGISRVVTLPDFQGLGLAFVLMDTVAAAHKRMGYRLRMYPAHPSFVRSFNRSTNWRMDQKPGNIKGFSALIAKDGTVYGTIGGKKTISGVLGTGKNIGGFSRPCAVFEYVGKPMDDFKAAYSLVGSQFTANESDRLIASKLRQLRTKKAD